MTKALNQAALPFPDLIYEFSLAHNFMTLILDGIPPNLKECLAQD